MSKNFNQFKTYMEISNNYTQNIPLYLTIKHFAVNKILYLMNQSSESIHKNELGIFEKLLNEFNQEKEQLKFPLLDANEYKAFLEQFYDSVDFEKANLYMLNVCLYLTEVLLMFGELDELAKKRSKNSIYNFS